MLGGLRALKWFPATLQAILDLVIALLSDPLAYCPGDADQELFTAVLAWWWG